MSDPKLQSLPRRVKYLHFLWHLKSSRVALNHLPKEIFLKESSDHPSNIQPPEAIDLKVSHMVKINLTNEVLLLQ